MNIAILGGRFDPPHIGHLWVAQQVLDYGPSIDEVWLIPAAHHQWKPIEASGEERMKMLQAYVMPRMHISNMELKRNGISYTIDTVREIKEYLHHAIYWIVGADIVSEFSRWEKTDELTRLATFLVFPRDPYTIPPTLPTGFVSIFHPNLIVSSLSSTVIRQRVREGRSLRGFVLPKVEEYIKEKGLYKASSQQIGN